MNEIHNSDQIGSDLIGSDFSTSGLSSFVAADSVVPSGATDNVLGIADSYSRGSLCNVSLRKIRENPRIGQFGAWCEEPEDFDKDIDRGQVTVLARSNPKTLTTTDFSTEDFISGIGQLEGSNLKFRFADFEEHRDLVDRVIKECQLRDYDANEIFEEVVAAISEARSNGKSLLKKADRPATVTQSVSAVTQVLSPPPSQPIISPAEVSQPSTGNELIDKLVAAITNLPSQPAKNSEPAPPAPVDTLSFPGISAFSPSRPTVPVVFHYGEQGDWQHKYHAVIDWGSSILAVFDTRWEEGSQYVPAAGKFLEISVPSLGLQKRQCMVSPVRGLLGVLELFTFYFAKPAESKDQSSTSVEQDQEVDLAGTSIGALLKGVG